MSKDKSQLLLALLAGALLLIAGCAPRIGSGEINDLPNNGDTLIDMPTLVIDFDAEGRPSFGDLPVVDLVNSLAPGVLDSVRLDQATLETMMANNIQHIQINNRTGGLMLLVNGLSVPSLRWDDETLQATAEMAKTFGAGLPELEKLLPLVRHLGIAVVARFPIAAGADEIPLIVESSGGEAAMQARDQFLAGIGRQPLIRLPILYHADGTFEINGLTDAEYTTLAPQIPWSALRLNPDILQRAVDNNISTLDITTTPEGVSIGINGQSLPHLGWDQGELQNLIELAGSMGVWEKMAESGTDPEAFLPLVENLLPIVQASNVSLSVKFPQGGVLSEIIPINGIQLYYEVHGEGEPLILVHGGLGNSTYWEKQFDAFAAEYQVIALDSRGHGRSTFSDEPIGYDLMMSDVIALMDHLGIEKANLLGWSDGGIIGIDMAINHPDRVDKIIAYGANYNPSGVRSDIEENEVFNAYVEKAIEDYLALSPAPEKLDAFFENIGNMWATEPNFTVEQLGAISTPILVLDGEDEEAILTEHTVEMAGLIPTAELLLMPGTGHFAMWEQSDEFNRIVLDYLAQ